MALANTQATLTVAVNPVGTSTGDALAYPQDGISKLVTIE